MDKFINCVSEQLIKGASKSPDDFMCILNAGDSKSADDFRVPLAMVAFIAKIIKLYKPYS